MPPLALGPFVVIERSAYLDPMPAFLADGICGPAEFLRDKAFEHRLVKDEHAVFAVAEQITPDCAAGLLVGLERHEADAAVGGRDFMLGEAVTDERRVVFLPVGEAGPDALLRRMVVGDREGHDMLERISPLR